MVKQQKVEALSRLEKQLGESQCSVFTDFRGLSAPQMTDLRRRLRKGGSEYRVVKNTLLRFALEKQGIKDHQPLLDGPTAIAFSQGDERELSRLIGDFLRTTRSPLRIKGGILGGKPFTSQEFSALATLPSKPELVAKVAGGLKAPLAALVFTLSGLMGGLLTVLQGRVRQLENEGGKG